MPFFKFHLGHSKKSDKTNGKTEKIMSLSEGAGLCDLKQDKTNAKTEKIMSSSEGASLCHLKKDNTKISLDSDIFDSNENRRKNKHESGICEFQKEKTKHKHFYSKLFHHKEKKSSKLDIAQTAASSEADVKPKRTRDVTRGMTDLDRRRYERLVQIANLEAYMDYTRRNCSDDEIPIVPNRLCCALILQESLIRQERQYIKDVLHGRLPPPGRRSSTSTIPANNKAEVSRQSSAPAFLCNQKTTASRQRSAPVASANQTTAAEKSRRATITQRSGANCSRQVAVRKSSCGEETPDDDEEEEDLDKKGFYLGNDDEADETDEDWLKCYHPTKQSWRSGPVLPQQKYDIY